MWVPPEIKGLVPLHSPTRKSVACFGAVSVQTGKFVRAISPKFDALTFAAFLKTLLRHRARGRRMVVVLDNAGYHQAVLLASLAGAHAAVPPGARRTSPPSGGSGSSQGTWPSTTGISPPWPTYSRPSKRASTDGQAPIHWCDGYAALSKTLCLEPLPKSKSSARLSRDHARHLRCDRKIFEDSIAVL